MKKYIQPKIEIDELEAKDIVLISDIFNIIGGNKDAGEYVDQNVSSEDVNGDGTKDKVGNVNVGVGIFGGGGVQ